MGKRGRGLSFVFALVMGLLAANAHPFKSSPFDQYQGDQGVQPYQHLIDYADSKGALVFWNHLETPVSEDLQSDLIEVKTRTDPHPKDLLKTQRYTGFQAVGRSRINAVEPGKEWDQLLQQYLEGQRDRPVWGYGPGDYRCEDHAGNPLGGIRTVVLAKQKNRAAMVEALAVGRMYAVKLPDGKNRLSLDAFELIDTATDKRSVMGEELKTSNPLGIGLKLSMTGGTSDAPAHIRLIRNGRVVKQAVLNLPYEGVWQDADPPRRGYYRLLVEVGDDHRLVANPIFFHTGHPDKPEAIDAVVKVPSSPPQASSLPEASVPPSTPTAPASAPLVEPAIPDKKYVEVTGQGVRLRKGPSTQFPVVGKVGAGERLLFVRRTDVMFNGKPWIVIDNKGELAYVWEGLVKSPAD